jgi:hypothetical protein
MRPSPLLLGPFLILAPVALVSVGGCGGKREEPAAAMSPISASNDAGIKVTVTSVKEKDKSLVLLVTLRNDGKDTVTFKNPESLRVGGFKVAADGREAIGADAGKMQVTKSRSSRLKELAAGAESELDLKYTFEPALAHSRYPWTLTISNMFVDDKKIGDVTIAYSPDQAK